MVGFIEIDVMRRDVGGHPLLNIVHRFVDEVNTRGHLSPLLNGVQLTVGFEIDDESVCLYIDNGILGITEEAWDNVDVFVKTNGHVLNAMLVGELKLRKAREGNQLELKGSIRNSLLLESLFLLGLGGAENKETDFLKKSG